jgi:hypothetical protein
VPPVALHSLPTASLAVLLCSWSQPRGINRRSPRCGGALGVPRPEAAGRVGRGVRARFRAGSARARRR